MTTTPLATLEDCVLPEDEETTNRRLNKVWDANPPTEEELAYAALLISNGWLSNELLNKS